MDIQEFVSKINMDELWCPDADVTHESWLVSLVCAILETFTTRSYLGKLIPICRVKVLLFKLNYVTFINNFLL